MVEPGVALAEKLRERAAGLNLDIVVSRFEEAAVSSDAFNLVVAATAFHWMDADFALARCADALQDNGWLALWWNVFGDETRLDPFRDALRPILAAKAPQLVGDSQLLMPYALDTAARRAEIDRSGCFGSVQQELFRWEGRHDPGSLRRMFATFSPWIALQDPLRDELLTDIENLARHKFGGLVVRPYQTVLYLAQRKPRG